MDETSAKTDFESNILQRLSLLTSDISPLRVKGKGKGKGKGFPLQA
jgi:hypothetical protein